VQQAARKAHEALERFCQVEREERFKAAARAEIAWLERELREAKAKLRAKPAVAEPSAPPASPLANQAAIRGWCVAQGIEVPAKGRLPRGRSRPTRRLTHEPVRENTSVGVESSRGEIERTLQRGVELLGTLRLTSTPSSSAASSMPHCMVM
jgi:hypothetical protein